jgi:hypothetical protein
MSGPMLLQLARSYVGSVNNGAVPNLGSAWASATAAACNAALSSATALVDSASAVSHGAGGLVPLHQHVAVAAASHSALSAGTGAFEWGDGGGTLPHSAWLAARPLIAPAQGNGVWHLACPGEEQVVWALHDGQLPAPTPAASGSSVPPSPPAATDTQGSGHHLHSAMWEALLQRWGVSQGEVASRVATPLGAAAALHDRLLTSFASRLWCSEQLRRDDLLKDTGDEAASAPWHGLGVPAAASSRDAAVMLSAITASAVASLRRTQAAQEQALQAVRLETQAIVQAAERSAGGGEEEGAALRLESAALGETRHGDSLLLGNLQSEIVLAQQRIAQLRSAHREASIEADAAAHAHELQVQELQLQIQQARLRAARSEAADTKAEQGSSGSNAAAEAEAARTRSVTRAAAARAQRGQMEAAAAAARRGIDATAAADAAAAAALRKPPVQPEDIHESDGVSAGCCAVQ